ncbi:MAG: hypothetical protein HY647_02740 [Acidobacteria bacterium]|nr:hypothetical protein [Acidobacteriota bacterium]
MSRAVVVTLLFALAVQEPLASLCHYNCPPPTVSENSTVGTPCQMAMEAPSSCDALLHRTLCNSEWTTVQAVSVTSGKELPGPDRAHGFQSHFLYLPNLAPVLFPSGRGEFRSFSVKPTLPTLRI